MNDYYTIYLSNDYRLYHHGILGQKWGIRRYQNSDGTLTAEGRRRYNNGRDIPDKDITFKKKFETVYADSSKIRRYGQELGKTTAKIVDTADDIYNQYDKELKDLKNDSKFAKKVIEQAKTEWDLKDVDDPELLELAVYDTIDYEIGKYISKDLQKKEQEFNELVDQYYTAAKKATNDIVQSYGDIKVSDTANYRTAVENSMHQLGNSQLIRYLYNHQESFYLEHDSYQDLVKNIADEIKNEYSK